ncbi:MAG: transporter [Sphingomonas bacterium]|uniref:spinster family MFS transporter n=1 Tax=Sphingomonas bacterium TaxID=1895847 RepID=UPI002626EC9E|nr:MFS transporter [Sphingomonas bacterium]MDB5703858.1 transporter [Sphingomonas bacterium]
MKASISSLRRHRHYRLFVLAVLLIVYIFNYIDRQIIGILSVPIKAELGLSDSQMGMLGGLVFAIFFTTLGIPIARVADRLNRTAIMAAALSLWSVFTGLCGMAGSFTLLLVARLGVGVGEAGGMAPAYSLIADYFPQRERGRAMGFFSLGLPLGSALGLLVGGYFGAHYGWRATFIGLGVAGVVLAPLFLLAVKEPVRGAADLDHDADAPVPTLGQVFAHLKTQPAFWSVSIAAGIAAMMNYGLAFWLPAYVQRSHGLNLSQTSQFLSAIAFVGGGLGMFGGGWLADRMAKHSITAYARIPAWSSLLALVFLIAALNMPTLPLTFGVLLIAQMLTMFYGGPSMAVVHLSAPASMRATTAAFFLFITNIIGLGLGTMTFGFASDLLNSSFGQESLAYAIMACAVIFYSVAAAVYFLAIRHLRQTERTLA